MLYAVAALFAPPPGLPLVQGVSLAPLTTLGLGGPADVFLRATTDAALARGLDWARNAGLPVLVFGGGSNLVIGDEGFGGLALQVATRGIASRTTAEGIEVSAAAGEPWDAFVDFVTTEGWAGLECLAGIPGLVGATPVQNVGAYGQEVAETLLRVRVLDRETLAVRWLDARALDFAYRDSLLRREPTRFVVLEVVFGLRPGGLPSLRYGELARALADEPLPSLARVRQTVVALRRKKSMVLDAKDPNTQSAGSFFVNPVVDAATADAVRQKAVALGLVPAPDQVPSWPLEGGRVKLAAGWLIERAGFARGERWGAVGLSSAHALALVHHGGGTTRALVALARRIQQGVEERFGVRLEPEPMFINVGI